MTEKKLMKKYGGRFDLRALEKLRGGDPVLMSWDFFNPEVYFFGNCATDIMKNRMLGAVKGYYQLLAGEKTEVNINYHGIVLRGYVYGRQNLKGHAINDGSAIKTSDLTKLERIGNVSDWPEFLPISWAESIPIRSYLAGEVIRATTRSGSRYILIAGECGSEDIETIVAVGAPFTY